MLVDNDYPCPWRKLVVSFGSWFHVCVSVRVFAYGDVRQGRFLHVTRYLEGHVMQRLLLVVRAVLVGTGSSLVLQAVNLSPRTTSGIAGFIMLLIGVFFFMYESFQRGMQRERLNQHFLTFTNQLLGDAEYEQEKR